MNFTMGLGVADFQSLNQFISVDCVFCWIFLDLFRRFLACVPQIGIKLFAQCLSMCRPF